MDKNERYGKLFTIEMVQKGRGNPYRSPKWKCKCDCGNETIVSYHYLKTSPEANCGCKEYKNKKQYDRFDYLEYMKNFINKNIKKDQYGCWLWMKAKHRQGYGSIRFKNKFGLVHRVVWEVYKGEIPEGMKVCHSCDQPACCNPDHLFLGTQKDNVYDMINKGRKKINIRKTRRNKLNYEQVQEIKALHGNGMTRKELEKKFSVSQTCIAKILTGVSWKVNWSEEL